MVAVTTEVTNAEPLHYGLSDRDCSPQPRLSRANRIDAVDVDGGWAG